ncbi:MAG: alanine--tRNA ligase-related protein, partial [Patescibacteria group bacterium]|nr:alanine--tRNA ligase-related protein [Patescibacteria group bacterium]
MTSREIREKFIEFFKNKGHKLMPSSSLIPNDPSVLFTTAGMQQFKDFYLKPELVEDKNIVAIQKCIRTGDIE